MLQYRTFLCILPLFGSWHEGLAIWVISYPIYLAHNTNVEYKRTIVWFVSHLHSQWSDLFNFQILGVIIRKMLKRRIIQDDLGRSLCSEWFVPPLLYCIWSFSRRSMCMKFLWHLGLPTGGSLIFWHTWATLFLVLIFDSLYGRTSHIVCPLLWVPLLFGCMLIMEKDWCRHIQGCLSCVGICT